MLLFILLFSCNSPCRGEACLAAADADPPRAMEMLDKGCSDGVTDACGEAARRREFGFGTAIDLPAAFAAYERLCEAGAVRGCMAAGNMLRKGTAPGGADPARARALIQRACEAGDGLGCMAVAQIAMEDADFPAARAAAERACKLGEPLGCGAVQQLDAQPPPALPDERACEGEDLAACHGLAAALLDGGGGPGRVAEARQKLAELCEQRGFMPACLDYGVALSRGLGGPADPVAAAQVYERTCAQLPTACHNLGVMLTEGRGVPADVLRAEAYFMRACEGGEAGGCLMGANLASDRGEGPAARERWQRACEGELPLGCANLGLDLIEPATGLAADPGRGVALISQACEARDPHGCAVLGRELLRGTYVAADPARAQELLTWSCQQGVDAACELMGLR